MSWRETAGKAVQLVSSLFGSSSKGMGERTPAFQVPRGASYLWAQILAATMVGVVALVFIARLISTSQMDLLAMISLVLGHLSIHNDRSRDNDRNGLLLGFVTVAWPRASCGTWF
jgi:hypothetical protein